MVPDLPVLAARERAVAYSSEDAFEAACVALCEAPASKLQAKPPMSDLRRLTKLEPWLRRELCISDTIGSDSSTRTSAKRSSRKSPLLERSTGIILGTSSTQRNARVLLKHVLKRKYKEKPRLRLESRLWRGMRRIKCFGLPGVGTHLSVCVTVNWMDDAVLVQLEQMETCEFIPLQMR